MRGVLEFYIYHTILGLTPGIEVVISVVLGVKFNCICTKVNFYPKLVTNIRLFHILASSLAGVCQSQGH